MPLSSLPLSPPAPICCSLSSPPRTDAVTCRPGGSKGIPTPAGQASIREEGSTPVGLIHSERPTSLLEDLTAPLTYSENLPFVGHLEVRRQFRVREEGNERDRSFYAWTYFPVASKNALFTFVKLRYSSTLFQVTSPLQGLKNI